MARDGKGGKGTFRLPHYAIPSNVAVETSPCHPLATVATQFETQTEEPSPCLLVRASEVLD